jgi:hypothetical protein
LEPRRSADLDRALRSHSESALTAMDTESPSGTDAADAERTRREVTKLVNAEIRAFVEGDVLAHSVEEEHYGFLCECGCTQLVEIPLSLYDTSGAWAEGHKSD